MEEKTEAKDYYGDYVLTEVPAAKRRSLLSLILILGGVICCVPAMYAGMVVGTTMTLGMGMLAILVGCGIVGFLGGFTAVIAERHGVGAVMVCRGVFGRWGAALPAIMIVVTLVGWYGVNTGFFGQLMSVLVPGQLMTSPTVAALWGGLLMMTTAVIGFRGIAFLSFLAIPIFVIVLLASIALVISDFGISELFAIAPVQHLPFVLAATAMAGGVAMGMVSLLDYMRYAKRDRDAYWSFFIAIVVTDFVVIGTGAALTLVTGEANLPLAMVGLGLGAGALGILILGQWTTNDNNIYCSGMALVNMIPVKKWILTLFLGLAGTALGVLGVTQYFLEFLILQGTYFPPIAGVILADYFVVRKYFDGVKGRKRYEYGEGAKYKVVNVAGILSFVIAGYLASIMPGLPVVNGVAIAAALYLLVAYMCTKLNIPYRVGEVKEGKKGY